jgi:hypothetical protein
MVQNRDLRNETVGKAQYNPNFFAIRTGLDSVVHQIAESLGDLLLVDEEQGAIQAVLDDDIDVFLLGE